MYGQRGRSYCEDNMTRNQINEIKKRYPAVADVSRSYRPGQGWVFQVITCNGHEGEPRTTVDAAIRAAYVSCEKIWAVKHPDALVKWASEMMREAN